MNEAASELRAETLPVKFTEKNLRNFWLKVDRNGPLPDQRIPHYLGLDRCWVWASKKRGGYGRFLIKRKPVAAHRVMWQISFGAIQKGLCVLHRCDNPSCVNPSHLFCGTQNDNNKDKAAKGRARSICGDEHHSRKNPECRAVGERSGARKHPDKIPRGQRHGRMTKPERTARGETAGQAKLTEIQVREIRQRYIPKLVTLKTLAIDFNICPATVLQIIARKTWTHIP